jgi:rhodanese-related sulfurtransferase
MDLPGTFDVVDIRPAEHFADYNVKGAKNVDIAELLNNPAYLTGVGPLVVVCRDGSLSLMVAGILSQKSARPIKALYGGLEAYWSESGLGGVPSGGAAGPAGRAPAASATPATGAAAAAPTAPAAPMASPKKKKAGC